MDAPPVQYVKTSDGYDIAYTVCGEGRPLILCHTEFTNVQLMWHHHPAWMEGLAERFKLICFDHRGEGFSSRGLSENTTVTDFGRDLDALADRFKGERFVLYALAVRSHTAVRFAVANPSRVDAVILNGAGVSKTAWPSVTWELLPRENWQFFLSSIAPRNLSKEELRQRVREFESCLSREEWNVRVGLYRDSNIENELRQLRAPMLVMHSRGFRLLAAEASMSVAAAAPNARFVLLDGAYVWGNAAQGLAAIDAFLTDHPATRGRGLVDSSDLSGREREVLRLLAAGKSNQEIADELVISLHTSRKHVSNILTKTDTANRTEAAAYARDHGLL